jgi:hypothetical protein
VNAERFDMAATRTALVRIDDAWDRGLTTPSNSFHEVRALLDRALAAIDAGWPEPAGDVVERATVAAWDAWDGERIHTFSQFRPMVKAALRSAGRMPEPFAITDEMVEAAARVAWLAPDDTGKGGPEESWSGLLERNKRTRRNEARAVLEYAATLQPAAPTSRPFRPSADMVRGSVMIEALSRANFTEEQTIEALTEHAAILERDARRLPETSAARISVPILPRVDPREERLTRYRCAAPAALALRCFSYADQSDVDIACAIEDFAHVMIAAERPAKVAP